MANEQDDETLREGAQASAKRGRTRQPRARSASKALEVALRLADLDRKASMPVLSHVRLEAVDGRLTIAATDLTRQVVACMAWPAAIAARVVKPHHVLASLNGAGSASSVDLVEADGDRLLVRCGGAQAALAGLPPRDFPKVHACAQPAGCAAYDVSRFVESLPWLLAGMSTDESRPHLYGLAFDGGNLVAMTGHVAHLESGWPTVQEPRKAPAKDPAKDPALAPRGVVETLLHALVLVKPRGLHGWVHEGRIWFRLCSDDLDVTVSGALSDAKFPPYERMRPESFSRTARVDAAGLAAALRRGERWAKNVREWGPGNVVVKVTLAGDAIALAIDERDATWGLRVPAVCQGDLTIGVIAGCTALALDGFSGDVDLQFGDEVDPIVVAGAGPRVAIVMPARV